MSFASFYPRAFTAAYPGFRVTKDNFYSNGSRLPVHFALFSLDQENMTHMVRVFREFTGEH